MTTAFLASVTSVCEAQLAVSAGCDIIDAKDPSRGALGALPVATVLAIRSTLPRSVPVSATIGDLVSDYNLVSHAALAMAESGCDLVKIGFFPGGEARGTVRALGRLKLGGTRLVGLLLVDRAPDFTLLPDLAAAGFVGVMLDTASKASGSLRDHATPVALANFVVSARALGLFAGFAGSLRLSDIAELIRLKPDVLGFRGAVCDGDVRTQHLDPIRLAGVRREIDDCLGLQVTPPQKGTNA